MGCMSWCWNKNNLHRARLSVSGLIVVNVDQCGVVDGMKVSSYHFQPLMPDVHYFSGQLAQRLFSLSKCNKEVR